MSPAVALQYLLPQKTLTRLVYLVMRWRWRPWKNAMIRTLARIYRIDLAEATSPDADDYPHFNAFFTRALRADARREDPDPAAWLMPADGRISQLGRIDGDVVFQAKGHSCTTAELLGGDAAAAEAFQDGSFITVYLSPRDYHRVHCPAAGVLRETVHVPGRLFSVAPFTVEAVPRLFARNERLACHFQTPDGPMALVMVGAMLVSGVETVWNGVEIPPYARRIVRRDYRAANPPVALARGAELGRFNMGSTVVVLLPPGLVLDPGLAPGDAVRLLQRLALPHTLPAP